MNTIPDKDNPVPIVATSSHIPQHTPPPRVIQPRLHFNNQNSLNLPYTQDHQESSENTVNGSTLTWTQRLNYIANNQFIEPQGFIWDSLDSSMDDVQKAKQMRKSGPIRRITNRNDKSYNAVRSTFRLHRAERRKSNIKNFVSLIRIALDYDIYKARAMAVLNSKARIIIFIMIDLAVDVLFCILYLIEANYLIGRIPSDSAGYPDPKWLFIVRPPAIWTIAVAMSSWNLMSAVIRFIFADNKLRCIFSFQTLLDAITAIPFLLSGAFTPNGKLLYVPYFLRSWSVISRLQRALSIGVDIGISDQPYDPVKAKLIILVAYFIAILYNGMAAFLYTETMFAPATEKPHSVGDALYFILITASTVGYGDITPKSIEGKVVVMAFIIVALSIIPGLIAGTIDTIKSARSGGGSYSPSRGLNGIAKKYLVMIGDFQNEKRMSEMLGGFLNKEFSESDIRVVFLSRNKPSKGVKTLLDMPMHKNKVAILVGNGLDEIDLKRCQVQDASAVFIIPDYASSEQESQDTMTTLLAWSLHIYAPDTRVFTFNLLPGTESFQWNFVEQAMCIGDVKQLLLAYSCRHRGVSTLILNLLHPSEPLNSYNDGWKAQYGDGAGNEIYVGSVPEVFIGWTFAQASWFIFQEFQSILIGVDIFLKYDKHDDSVVSFDSQKSTTSDSSVSGSFDTLPEGSYHLALNPGNSYRLGKYDELIFIAQSPEDMDAIKNFSVDQYERLCAEGKSEIISANMEFTKAMEMYYSLRGSRAKARAAAKRRMKRRKDKSTRYTSREETKEQSEYGYETLSPEVQSLKDDASLTIQRPESSRPTIGTRPRKVYHKNSRPAWNVALYDNEDDDDGDTDGDSVNSSTSQQFKSDMSGQNAHTHSSSRNWQRRRSSNANNDNLPIGALDREKYGFNDAEYIPMSNRKLWPEGRNLNQGTNLTVSTQLSIPEFYPSNFDRNAATAAEEDKLAETSSVSQETHPDKNKKMGALNEVKLEITIKPTPTNCEPNQDHGAGVGTGNDHHENANFLRQLTNHSIGGLTYNAYQPLDETTYVGQSYITRSENTLDLPLCHLLINPPKTIKPLIRDDLSMQKDHIVACANAGENLYRFLSTLRLAHIPKNEIKTIVVLTSNPYEIVDSDDSGIVEDKNGDDGKESGDSSQRPWNAILSFPKVFWVVGNCQKQRDLVRAGILGASSIVVMSHRSGSLDREEFEDSTAIMAHHMIYQTLEKRGLLSRQNIVVEISEKSNIRFLTLSVAPTRSENRRGLMVKSSQMKTRQLRARVNSGGFWMEPIFASGQVLVSSLLDNVLYQAYSKAHVLDLVKICCGVRFKQAIEMDQILGIDCSSIYLIEPPPLYVGKSFSSLFGFLSLCYGIIPVGLYRYPDPNLNNTLPFVFTNPLPGILLKETDMIYVLKS